ncbi:biopolymer transporter ExbD [Oleiagrimonas sp. C23AA]|uniref:ExbD/TolR family protein n=1 Tax=Oleiagrimonas sp. C23AA TaxID=2719047 RepID=UPI001423A7D0|nr:biopolymer transporter ExbD [Oleiagrimonas sp. C23AA]NII10910.1 biopolymer transporter ExbD [Oleiagrimonas sp. C23AA]
MRIGNSRRRDDFEINVISLIDVLLTLLMFFVLTTTFVRHARMQVNLPKASAHPSAATSRALVIVVDRNGHYFIGPNEVLGQGEDALERAITSQVGNDRSRPVTLRADAMAHHQAVVTAMDALGRLGFTHLSIATTPQMDAGDTASGNASEQ